LFVNSDRPITTQKHDRLTTQAKKSDRLTTQAKKSDRPITTQKRDRLTTQTKTRSPNHSHQNAITQFTTIHTISIVNVITACQV